MRQLWNRILNISGPFLISLPAVASRICAAAAKGGRLVVPGPYAARWNVKGSPQSCSHSEHGVRLLYPAPVVVGALAASSAIAAGGEEGPATGASGMPAGAPGVDPATAKAYAAVLTSTSNRAFM